MKKFLSLFLVLPIIAAMIISCGSGEKEEETKKSTKKRADVPTWFMSPPSTEDALYAVGYAKKAKMQLALTTARNRASDELSRTLGLRVTNMVKDFIEEGTVGSGNEETGQTVEFTQSVSKSLTDNAIALSKIDQQEIYEFDDGSYEAFCLIKLSLADMTSKIDEVLKNNAAAFAKLQANKGFDELKESLKELRGSDPNLQPSEGKIVEE